MKPCRYLQLLLISFAVIPVSLACSGESSDSDAVRLDASSSTESPEATCAGTESEVEFEGELIASSDVSAGYIECVYLSSGSTGTTTVCPDGATVHLRMRQVVRINAQGDVEVGNVEPAGDPC